MLACSVCVVFSGSYRGGEPGCATMMVGRPNLPEMCFPITLDIVRYIVCKARLRRTLLAIYAMLGSYW